MTEKHKSGRDDKKEVAFWDEPREQSIVKSEIVAKYFSRWAKVILKNRKGSRRDIAYIVEQNPHAKAVPGCLVLLVVEHEWAHRPDLEDTVLARVKALGPQPQQENPRIERLEGNVCKRARQWVA